MKKSRTTHTRNDSTSKKTVTFSSTTTPTQFKRPRTSASANHTTTRNKHSQTTAEPKQHTHAEFFFKNKNKLFETINDKIIYNATHTDRLSHYFDTLNINKDILKEFYEIKGNSLITLSLVFKTTDLLAFHVNMISKISEKLGNTLLRKNDYEILTYFTKAQALAIQGSYYTEGQKTTRIQQLKYFIQLGNDAVSEFFSDASKIDIQEDVKKEYAAARKSSSIEDASQNSL